MKSRAAPTTRGQRRIDVAEPFAGANLVFVWSTFAAADVPEKNTLITVGRLLGLHVALAMIFQLLLIARIPWLDRRLGMDRLTSLHRVVGFALFGTLVLRLALIVAGFAQLYGNPVPVQIVSLAGSVPVLLGLIAFGIVAVVVVVSARAVRPEPMTVAVLDALRALGMPRSQIHAERFRPAG